MRLSMPEQEILSNITWTNAKSCCFLKSTNLPLPAFKCEDILKNVIDITVCSSDPKNSSIRLVRHGTIMVQQIQSYDKRVVRK